MDAACVQQAYPVNPGFRNPYEDPWNLRGKNDETYPNGQHFYDENS
jgi:hypothetical protein